MVYLWSAVAPYFWPVVFAYILTGVYYILRDVSSKEEKPSYLSSPLSLIFVSIFWSVLLIRFFWRKWRRNSRHSFFKILFKQLAPLCGVFLLLAVDFTYLRTLMH